MKYSFWIISVVSTILIFSCSNATRINSDSELTNKIESVIKTGDSILKIHDLTDFGWDSLIVLHPYFPLNKIENISGITLDQIQHTNISQRDDICVIVFFKNNKAIHMVEYPRSSGDFANNELKFIVRGKTNYQILESNEVSISGDKWIVVKLIE